jgi:hypothetical protein
MSENRRRVRIQTWNLGLGIWNLLWRCFFVGFGGLLFALVPVVFALELLDAAGGVHVLHLAGEERMASRADFDGDVLPSAARDELIAATASHGGFFVFGMNAFFHNKLLRRLYRPSLKLSNVF